MDTGRLAFTPKTTSFIFMPLAFLVGGVLVLGAAIAGMSMPVEAATRLHMDTAPSSTASSIDTGFAKPTHAARHATRIRKLQAVPFIAFPPRI